MSLFQKLSDKPWEHEGTNRAVPGFGEGALQLPVQKVALRTFLAVLTVMFGLFIIAYYIRMDLEDWRPLPEPKILWLNTLVLILCSVSMQWTRFAINREQLVQTKLGLLLGGALTLGFVYGQLLAWQKISADGYFLYNNPANAFFYLLTGIHALHLLGGLWVWTRTSVKVWFAENSKDRLKEIKLSVELCGTYWHFLLLVWLVLFALMSYT